MTVQRIDIQDRKQWLDLRQQDVTASDIGCLFGLHPYKTPLALWAEKTGVGLDVVENSAMRRGRWLEDAVISACRDTHPDWQIVKPAVYLRDEAMRLGATPDAVANGDTIIQCKTVADRAFKAWDGAPVHYQMQALTEAMLWGAARAVLAVLVISPYGAEYHEIEIPRHEAAEKKIVEGVATFWLHLSNGVTPKADYAADAELLAKLYAPNDASPPLDLSTDNYLPDLLAERQALMETASKSEDRLKAIKGEIIEKMAGSPLATLPGWQITNKIQHRKESILKATSFPVLRITQKLETEKVA